MKKIGVVLGGCGVYDGSEIHEAVITLLAIARNGAQAVCFAPDKPQRDVINHLTGEAMPEQRNVLVEAARIARGDILPLTRHFIAEYSRRLGYGQSQLSPEAAQKLRAYSWPGNIRELENVIHHTLLI